MNNKEYFKIKKALNNLINSWKTKNPFMLFIKTNNIQSINNEPVIWNLKGKPNKNE